MVKEIYFNYDALDKLNDGIQVLVNAVGSTLGPAGNNVISLQHITPKVTKDGVSVAKEIELDGVEGVGVKIVRNAAAQTNNVAGDGTTTATILAGTMVRQGIKLLKNDKTINVNQLKQGMKEAADTIKATLDNLAHKDITKESLINVATISANNNKEIGTIVADAIEQVGGNDGIVTVDTGNRTESYIELVQGLKFNNGYVSPYFVNNKEKSIVEFENPFVLLYDGKINSINQIINLCEEFMTQHSGSPLVIIAEDFDDSVTSSMVLNNVRGGLKSCLVKAPSYGSYRTEELLDMAALVQAKLISPEQGVALDKVTLDCLGQAKKITVTKSDTLITGDKEANEALKERIVVVRNKVEQMTLENKGEYEIDKVKTRLAKLVGGVAVIRVGCPSGIQVEINELRDLYTDAICAVKSASDGLLAGGGSAFLKCYNFYLNMEVPNTNKSYLAGYDLVYDSIKTPILTLLRNAGKSEEEIYSILLSAQNWDKNTGYNVLEDKVEDLIKSGILDTVKVEKSALDSAVSVASSILSSKTVIIPKKEENKPMQTSMY